MGPAGRRRDVARARTRCAPTSPGMGIFFSPETRGPVPQSLAFLRRDRIAGIRARGLDQALLVEEVRESLLPAGLVLVQSWGPADTAQAPSEDAVTPSWPKEAVRATCPAPLSKEAAPAAGKLWGSGGWGRTCGGHFAGVAGHLPQSG